MAGGLDLASLYDQSGPALLGVLNVLVVVAWADFRSRIGRVGDVADSAEATAEEAKEQASENAARNDRQELLIDQNATDIEGLEEAVERNDFRIQDVQRRQAANSGDDFFRGGDSRDSEGVRAEPNGEPDT